MVLLRHPHARACVPNRSFCGYAQTKRIRTHTAPQHVRRLCPCSVCGWYAGVLPLRLMLLPPAMFELQVSESERRACSVQSRCAQQLSAPFYVYIQNLFIYGSFVGVRGRLGASGDAAAHDALPTSPQPHLWNDSCVPVQRWATVFARGQRRKCSRPSSTTKPFGSTSLLQTR